MAWKIEFLDGFEHYTNFLDKWDFRDDPYIYPSTSFARTGSRSLRLAGAGSVNRAYGVKALKVQAKSICLGFAFLPDEAGLTDGSDDMVLQLKSGVVNCVTMVFNLNNKFDLHLHYIGGTKISGTTTLTQGAWRYIELEFLIDDTAGAYHMKIDGVTEFSGTAVDTAGDSANPFVDRLYFWNNASVSKNRYVDDLCINTSAALETQGTGFVGDVEVRTVMATADGSNVDFTRSGGVSDYENVDEALIDGDTSYLHSNTSGHQVTLNLADITLTGGQSIKAVQACMGVMKSDAGYRQVKVMAKSGVTESLGVIQTAPSGEYHFQTEVWEVDPDTAAAWTESGFNAAEFGLEVV